MGDRWPYLDIERSKVKVVRSNQNSFTFGHSWWRHLANTFTNIGVKYQRLHWFTAQMHIRVLFCSKFKDLKYTLSKLSKNIYFNFFYTISNWQWKKLAIKRACVHVCACVSFMYSQISLEVVRFACCTCFGVDLCFSFPDPVTTQTDGSQGTATSTTSAQGGATPTTGAQGIATSTKSKRSGRKSSCKQQWISIYSSKTYSVHRKTEQRF